MEKEKMICPSCGAELDRDAAVCPFCGSTFHEGQEREYMERLDDILEDVDDIDDASREEYRKQLKSYGKYAAKIFRIVIISVIVLALAFLLFEKVTDAGYRRAMKQEMKFCEVYYPVLNELHEKGDYNGVLEEMKGLYNRKGSDALFAWEHWGFYSFYSSYQMIRDAAENPEKTNESDRYFAFFEALDIQYDEIYADDYNRLSAEERNMVDGYLDYAEQYLISQGETDTRSLYEELKNENGYLEYDSVKEYLTQEK